MYIFVRQDLTPAQQIVQAAHATHHAGIKFGPTELPTHFVLIGVHDQAELIKIAGYLGIHGIEHEMFYEPDFDTGYTAIATKPLYGSERKPLRKFKLLGD